MYKIKLFTGPSGSGKTTVLYKYAINYQRINTRTPLIIAANSYNIGSQNTLNKISSYTGFDCIISDFSSDLINTVESNQQYEQIFVDIPGVNLFDQSKVKVLKNVLKSIPDIEVCLVINICYQTNTIIEYIKNYEFTGYRDLVFSFVDVKTGLSKPDKMECINATSPEILKEIDKIGINPSFSIGDKLPGILYL